MPTFPPPRVDITSKTWPSFADMLLRRWREGEHLGRVFFFSSLRPSVTFSGWPEETTVGTPYQRRAPARIQAC